MKTYLNYINCVIYGFIGNSNFFKSSTFIKIIYEQFYLFFLATAVLH
jgi:hypothetical protein